MDGRGAHNSLRSWCPPGKARALSGSGSFRVTADPRRLRIAEQLFRDILSVVAAAHADLLAGSARPCTICRAPVVRRTRYLEENFF